MAEPNNKNGITLVNQFRSWLSDFRAAANNLVDLYQKRLDEFEVRITKEGIAQPVGKIEDNGVIDIDVIRSGEPEKRV